MTFLGHTRIQCTESETILGRATTLKPYVFIEGADKRDDFVDSALAEVWDHLSSMPYENLKTAVEGLITEHAELMRVDIQHSELRKQKRPVLPVVMPYVGKVRDGLLEWMVQDSLKWVLRWAFQRFAEGRGKRSERTAREIIAGGFAWERINRYQFGAHEKRGWWAIEVNGNTIQFHDRYAHGPTFIAYDAWRTQMRDAYTRHHMSTLGIPESQRERRLEKAIELDFEMPDNLPLGSYTAGEFKVFTMEMHRLALERRAKPISYYRQDHLIRKLVNRTRLRSDSIAAMVSDVTFTPSLRANADPSLEFLIPVGDGELAFPSLFYGVYCRPGRNLTALIAAKHTYLNAQQVAIEDTYRGRICAALGHCNVCVGLPTSEEQKKRPGMDILFLDPESRDLLVVETKFQRPPSEPREIDSVDTHIEKALTKQIPTAEKWIEDNFESVLSTYFGPTWKGIRPARVHHCIATNENIGSGRACSVTDSVITVDHLIELLQMGVPSCIDILRESKHHREVGHFATVTQQINVLDYSFLASAIQLDYPWILAEQERYESLLRSARSNNNGSKV